MTWFYLTLAGLLLLFAFILYFIVKSAKDAEKVLRSLCKEMDDRYELMSRAGINKITLYNEKFKDRKLNPEHGHRFFPYLVVVVDEYADLLRTSAATPGKDHLKRRQPAEASRTASYDWPRRVGQLAFTSSWPPRGHR